MLEKILKYLPVYLYGLASGIILIVTLNSLDMVIMVNIWPSVLTAHGVM